MDALLSTTAIPTARNILKSSANPLEIVKKIEEAVQEAFAGYSVQNGNQLVKLLDECLRLSPNEQAIARNTFDALDTRSTTLLERLIHTNDNESSPCTVAALKLIELGVKAIHTQNAGGGYHHRYTLAHVAAEKGKLGVLKALVDAGVDPDAVAGCGINPTDPKRSMTPLSCSLTQIHPRLHSVRICQEVEERYKQIFKYLLARGVDPKKGNVLRNPVFHTCIDCHLEDLAWTVLDRSEIDAFDSCQATPLFLACAHGMDKLVEELLRRGAQPDVLCRPGVLTCYRLTPLHAAVLNGFDSTVALLLGAGADPNVKSVNPLNDPTPNPSLPHGDPLTSFQLAVDLHSPARDCRKVIEAFSQHSRKELDTNVSLARTVFDAQRHYGHLSLPLRLITEMVRVKGAVKQTGGIRCFSSDTQFHSNIVNAVRMLITENQLGGAESICRPIINAMLDIFAQDSEMAIYFLTPEQIRQVRGDNIGVGCYNADTGHQILVAIDSDSIMRTLIHEATHKLAHQFYQLAMAPIHDPAFQEAMRSDSERLGSSPDVHLDIKYLFGSVKILYEKDKWPSEFLARIPEAAVKLAYNHGCSKEEINTIFQKSIPNLYRFFQTDSLPRCLAYHAAALTGMPK
ncbi:MAG: ankyrin repeat domain-containing protein [Parachlamydia sp.]|nr:ankyrin repeat domain-containing protein [Parachlamydia sp.]